MVSWLGVALGLLPCENGLCGPRCPCSPPQFHYDHSHEAPVPLQWRPSGIRGNGPLPGNCTRTCPVLTRVVGRENSHGESLYIFN